MEGNLFRANIIISFVFQDVFPVFPSAKYPNIVSMMTGTFAENHNVLDEEIYDSKSKRTISKNETVFWKSTRELGTIWVRKKNTLILVKRNTVNPGYYHSF